MSNIEYSELVGAIYDVDDTLLNNHPDDGNPYNLHERSRLAAIYSIATEMGYSALLNLSAEENERAFLEAPAHTMDSATWLILHRYGVVQDADLVHDHPVLHAIISRKAEMHMELLKAASEINGASAFVLAMEQNGLAGKQAIASGARLDEIQTFLGKYNLSETLPRARIIARGDYVHPKPHADPFDRAFKTLGLPDTPEIRLRTLAVEDDPKGYMSAYQAGLFTCVVTTRFPEEAFVFDGHQPYYAASDMAELGDMLHLPKALA